MTAALVTGVYLFFREDKENGPFTQECSSMILLLFFDQESDSTIE
jgi:hypothetical protein